MFVARPLAGQVLLVQVVHNIQISDPAGTMADGTCFGARAAGDGRQGGGEITSVLLHVASGKISIVA